MNFQLGWLANVGYVFFASVHMERLEPIDEIFEMRALLL